MHASFPDHRPTKLDERTISHIEEFGCSIVQVKSSTCGVRVPARRIRKWVKHLFDTDYRSQAEASGDPSRFVPANEMNKNGDASFFASSFVGQ